MKLISFALGTLHRWVKDDNMAQLLKFVKKLDIQGLEITLATWDNVYKLKFSSSDLKYLKGLEYVSIHAPFRIIRGVDDAEGIKRLLSRIEEIYKMTDSKAVIIHPCDIPEPKTVKKYNFNVITETVPKAHKEYRNLKLEKVFKKYPKIGLCLDVAHSYRNSKNETEYIVKKFKKRIKQIHLSGVYRNRDHISLRCVTKDFLKSIEPIKELDVPIIIEEGFGKNDINSIKKEIKLVRELLF
jgi:endonuclease IV